VCCSLGFSHHVQSCQSDWLHSSQSRWSIGGIPVHKICILDKWLASSPRQYCYAFNYSTR
jgi:hypothetical protein